MRIDQCFCETGNRHAVLVRVRVPYDHQGTDKSSFL